MSRMFLNRSFLRSLLVSNLALLLVVPHAAFGQAAPSSPNGGTGPKPPIAPSPVPAATDAEVTVDAETKAEPAATAATETNDALPAPAAAAVTPATAPLAPPAPVTTPPPVKASVAAPARSADETTSLLAEAGYPLTPGVSALPLNGGFVVSGYLQAQYESHQDSVDQLQQGGALLNQNRFLLRRGRFRVARDWEWAQLLLEVDGNTVRGPAMRVQKAEASLIYGRSKDRDQPPILQVTMGQFDLPFGFEVPYTPRVRWFMERTQFSRAFWPSEPDIGARVSGGLGFARYSVAVTNGEPLDEKSGFPLQDPNANKDITARFGAEAKTSRSVVVAGGVSYNRGKSLSPGASATKNSIQWTDTNGSGKIDPNGNELVGQPASAALVSQNFDRWAVGADVEFLLRTRLGWSMLYGEVVSANNEDRGLYVANPVQTGSDIRELGYYVAFTQEVTRHGVVGFRYDSYDPNSDRTDQRRGKIVPASQQIRTASLLAGLVLPGSARLMFQYDIIRDSLARNTLGVPTDLANNQWTLRLQVSP